MSRRPHPNPRRGIIRAAIAVVILVLLLLLAIIIVSSFSAQTVKAPSVQPTPGPLPTPIRTVKPGPSVGPTRKPGPTVGPTRKRAKYDVGWNHAPVKRNSAAERAPAHVLSILATRRAASNTDTPARQWRTAFTINTVDPAHSVLWVRSLHSARAMQVRNVDSLIQPVWAPSGDRFLFVRVAATVTYPGERWSLNRFDLRSGRAVSLTSAVAMNLAPLGWQGSRALYATASATDTSIYAVRQGHVSFVSILIPQPLVTAIMSPDAHYVAFAAPTNCSYCTLDIFDLQSQSLWIGPSGLPDEHHLAWTADSQKLATVLKGRVAAIDVDSHQIRLYGGSASLERAWADDPTARADATGVTLFDPVTGGHYRSTPTG